ncbi:Clp protease ClpP [Pediococcus acidilactici]|uniref:ATP-dependent Clp protease proteolytic subunit n=1 Tax=Pediococcus acidilactici TaxID=1254 RepID=A0AAW8YLP7_PEDAC|nr:head maturation protease, ClpP-related [Pediococcus acidilactici]MDV2911035.1 Clp protease ClpP [Pediococcus acidilactici]WQS17641.1 Clp protease ClpP [Pediococcus acidilactici]
MTTKIDMKGPVITDDNVFFYNYFKMPYISPSKVNNELPDDGSDVELVINSNGGDVYSASDIWTSLKNYQGNITAKVYGMAASAASVIAMGADKLIMSPTARLMIHNASTYGMGDHRDFEDTADILAGTDKSIAQAYMSKTGKSEQEVLDIMAKTSFYTADEALEAGLIDEVMDFGNDAKEEDAPLFAASNATMIPNTIINRFRDEILNEELKKEPKKTEPVITDEMLDNIADKVAAKLEKTNKKSKTSERIVNTDPFVF